MINFISKNLVYSILLLISYIYIAKIYLIYNPDFYFYSIILLILNLIVGFHSNITKKLNLIIISILVFHTIIESFTKRMTSFYFYQIPNEIINILFDTNIDEIKGNLYFSDFECYGIIIIASIFSFIFLLSMYKDNKKINLMSALQLCVFFSVISFTQNPLSNEFYFFIKNKDNITQNINIIKERNLFKWHSNSYESEKQTIVIFLGETHRGDFLSINGYKKPTTPKLENQNIISYSNAISQAAYTLQSTPMILSRKNITNDKYIFNETSLISAYKEAGFKTWYVSYLSPTHIGDNEINIIANEADEYIRSNVNRKTLTNILSDNANKKLIIYKTVGSHYLYHTRYPESFNIFQPSFSKRDYTTPTLNDKEKLENSYSNSILYSVDYQVNEFIELLKNEKGLTSLSFISDHGTSIYDDEISLYGGNTKGNYRIGLFFWFNDEYIEKFPDEISILKINKDKKITSFYFFDTMLHIGKIETPYTKGASLFESPLIEKKRNIINKDIFDFDKDITK